MPSIADRVRELIEKAGQTRHAFATAVGLDDPKLSKSLGGLRRFSSLDLARIAEYCNVTVDWLVTGEEPELALAARTTGGQAGAALTAAKYYSTLRSDLASLGYPLTWQAPPPAAHLDVNRLVAWAHAQLLRSWQSRAVSPRMHPTTDDYVTIDHDPPFPAPRETSERDSPTEADAKGELDARQTPERTPTSLGSFWLSVIASGTLGDHVGETFGVDIAVVELGPGFDGLAASSGDAKLIVMGTSTMPARQHFTFAHELGHLLAGDDQSVHLDEDVYATAQSTDPSERRANAFAAAFLMPEQVLRERAGSTGFTERSFAELACDLRVSPSALAFRLKALRLVDSGNCDRFKCVTAAHAATTAGRGEWLASWTAATNARRLPPLLVRDAYRAYESGTTTLRPYANLLGVDVDDLRRELESQADGPDAL